MKFEYTPADLARIPGYWYLGTPFTDYPEGHTKAWHHACRVAGDFVRDGVPLFCPVAHGYSIALGADIDPRDRNLWSEHLRPFEDAAYGLIVVKLESWQDSEGLAGEIERFREARKPILYFDPFD